MTIEIPIARGRRPGERGWTSVARGLHYGETDAAPFLAALRAWQQCLKPDAAFTHLTSARVREWWLPPLPAGVPVWAVQSQTRNESELPGIKVIRRRPGPERELVEDLWLTTPAETLVHCAFDLGLLDTVVLCDAALHAGDVSIGELRRVAGQRRRGAPKLRAAIPLLDGRSESPWESVLRLFHLACGMDVEPQREFWHDGAFVARVDLWLVGTNVIHEYDGGVHREREAHESDLARERRLLTAGIKRRGFTSSDLLLRPAQILREADESLGREHDPGRIQAWHDLIKESLWTSNGHAQFCQRLGRHLKSGGLEGRHAV